MKRILTAVCCIALVSIPAFAQKTAEAKGAMAGKMKGAMTDQQFIDFAAQTDMVEANLGQLAQQVGDSQQVKDYGQMLTTDHTQDYQSLQTLATQANLTVPTAIDAQHIKAMVDPFQKLKGAAFDKKYASEMVAGHTKAIEVYKKEAADAENAAVKAYASQTLDTLQKHLAGAKDLMSAKKPAAAAAQ
jgi:putative membrane protein